MPEFNRRSKGLRALRDIGAADALVNPIPVLTLTETDEHVEKVASAGYPVLVTMSPAHPL